MCAYSYETRVPFVGRPIYQITCVYDVAAVRDPELSTLLNRIWDDGPTSGHIQAVQSRETASDHCALILRDLSILEWLQKDALRI